jgi:TrmH family RNA methyltransferase
MPETTPETSAARVHVRVVLHRPENGGNVGASARALKNMGFSNLCIVDPQQLDWDEATRMAHGAEDVLRAAARAATLEAAVADCRWVVGTTRRRGKRRQTIYTPRAFARAAAAAPGRRPLAIVFGPERDGLDAHELACCQDVVHIPASPAQPSLNLAHAVMVVVYELAQELEPGPDAAVLPDTTADAGDLEQLYAHLEEMLLAVGFARPETVAHQMRALRRVFARARLSPAEATQWRGICRQVLWAARRNGPDGV